VVLSCIPLLLTFAGGAELLRNLPLCGGGSSYRIDEIKRVGPNERDFASQSENIVRCIWAN